MESLRFVVAPSGPWREARAARGRHWLDKPTANAILPGMPPDRVLRLAEERGLEVPPPPHTPKVLGELAAAAFVRPQRSARRVSREDAYLATAVRKIVGTPNGDVVTWRWGIGAGPLIGLVHGWEGRGSQLGAFAAPLIAAGFRVLTFDAPGHGESPGDVAHVPLVARVLVALAGQLGPFDVLVGHSMGAAAAATAAVTGSRLRGLVMLAPPLSQFERVTRVAGRLDLSLEARDAFIKAVERVTATPYAEADLMALAAKAPCPLLVFHDPADTETSYSDAENIVARWKGAVLVPCQGRGHVRLLTTPAVIARVVEFIEGLRSSY